MWITDVGLPLRRVRAIPSRIAGKWMVLVVLTITALGCDQGPKQGQVIGRVTLDGKPLDGTVSFEPVDGKGATASAFIQGGAFEASVEVGQKKIRFSVPKVVGKRRAYETPDSPMIEDVEEFLPARYNVMSDLMIDVKAGKQDVQFNLDSKP